MRRLTQVAALLASLAVAGSIDAQGPTWRVGGRALFDSASATSAVVGDSDLALELESGAGLEIDAAVMFTPRFGAEISLASSAHELRAIGASAGCCGIDGGSVWLVPLTATLQYHPPVYGAWDPYLGLGLGLLEPIYSLDGDFDTIGVQDVDFDGDSGIVVQGGVSYRLGSNWYLNIDVRWFPATLEARVHTETEDLPPVKLDVDPLLAGFGVGWRF
jgi:outer membrane protein